MWLCGSKSLLENVKFQLARSVNLVSSLKKIVLIVYLINSEFKLSWGGVFFEKILDASKYFFQYADESDVDFLHGPEGATKLT